jgi:mitochondrial fission protein ELM1
MPDKYTVWRFVDGKPGHENQSAGLVEAMARLAEVQVRDVPVRPGWRRWLDWLLRRCPVPDCAAQRPDFLIGAGHATHLPMLACRRACDGRIVVLMKPSLPLRWFDLCIVPAHDQVPASDRILVSQGVLNRVAPGDKPDDAHALVLLGGPSAEYGWDEEQLVAQVQAVTAQGQQAWTVAGSRRTPDATLQRLRTLLEPAGTQVLAFAQTRSGWLDSQLQQARLVWVTEDSVSMVYEALTANAACGLLRVPVRRPGRVHRGVQALIARGLVMPYQSWSGGQPLQPPQLPFNEAERSAKWLLERA